MDPQTAPKKPILPRHRPLAPLLALLACLPTPLFAALFHDPDLRWRTLTTEHFAIHYHDGSAALAHELAGIAEAVHRRLVPRLQWQPGERTEVVIDDRVDASNGMATPLPRNTVVLYPTPPVGTSIIGDYDNWLELLFTHEYTHTLHLDRAEGAPAWLRRVFGRLIPLFPNLLQPPWLIEGLATHEETDHGRAIGRGQASLFRALMREETAHGLKPLRQVNQPLESWPMNTSRYLYGVYFYRYLAARYGEDRITGLVRDYSDNLIPFQINNNSMDVLGSDLSRQWDAFAAWLHADFDPEISAIRARGEGPQQRLTHHGYFASAPRLATNGDLYYLRNDARSEPRLMRLPAGGGPAQTVANSRATGFDLHPTAGIVSAELDRVRSTNLLADLYHIDPVSGRKRQLTHGARYVRAAWTADGRHILAVHNAAGRQALHRLDADGRLQAILWQGGDHSVIGGLDASPDGRHLAASVWRPNGLWNLELFDLQTRRWHQLTHDQDIETQPRFSADGRHVLFSADYGGVFNLREMDLVDGRIRTLSNLAGGSLGGKRGADGTLYLSALGRNGFDILRLPGGREWPTPAAAHSPSPRPSPPLTGAHDDTPYAPLPRLRPTWWYPWIAIGDTRSEIGLVTGGNDPLQRHSYALQAAYDTKNRWTTGRLDYRYDRWNPTLTLSAQRTLLSQLDGAGKALRYRNNDRLSLEALWPFFRYGRNLTLRLGVVSEREADQRRAAGIAPRSGLRDRLLGLALDVDSRRRYPRAIGPSHGQFLRLVAEDNDLLDSDASGRVYSADWRGFLDLPRGQILAARLAAGWGTDNPFPFRLGGSLSEAVPADPTSAALLGAQVFAHRRYTLRGYPVGLPGLSDRRMALASLEWHLPLALVERGWMAPPVGLHRVNVSLFFDLGDAFHRGSDSMLPKRGAGAELSALLVLGYWLPLDLRLGWARGLDPGGETQVYLRLGGSF